MTLAADPGTANFRAQGPSDRVGTEGVGKNSGRIKPENLVALKEIIQRDYGITLSDEEIEGFAFSLLRVTRLAMGAFNRAEDNRSMAIIT